MKLLRCVALAVVLLTSHVQAMKEGAPGAFSLAVTVCLNGQEFIANPSQFPPQNTMNTHGVYETLYNMAQEQLQAALNTGCADKIFTMNYCKELFDPHLQRFSQFIFETPKNYFSEEYLGEKYLYSNNLYSAHVLEKNKDPTCIQILLRCKENYIKTAVLQVRSIEIQTDLTLRDLDRQYSTIENQLEKIATLSNKQEVLKKRIIGLERNIKDQEIDLGSKDHALSIAKMNKESFEKEKEAYKEIIEGLNLKISQKIKEIENIKRDMLKNDHKSGELAREQKENIRRLNGQLNARQEAAEWEIAALKNQLENAQKEHNKMKQHLKNQEAGYTKQSEEQGTLKAQLEENNTELQKTIAALQRQIDDQKVDLDSRDDAISKAHIDNALLKAQNQAHQQRYTQDVDVLNGQIAQKIEEVENAKKETLLLKKENNKLSQEQKNKINENAQLQDQVSTLERISKDAQDENTLLKSELSQFLLQIKNSEIKHSDLEKQINYFKKQVQECKTHTKELEKALAEEKKAFEDARNKWEEESTQAVKELLDSVQKSEDSIGSAEQIIDGAIEQKKDLLGAVAIATDTMNKLSETIAEKKIEIRNLSENNKEEKSRLQKQIADLEKVEAQLKEEKKDIEQKEITLKKENEILMQAMKAQAEKHNAEMQQVIAKSDSTTEEKKAFQKEADQQKEKLNNVIKLFEDLKISSAKTVDDLNKKTSEVQEVIQKFTAYHHEKD